MERFVIEELMYWYITGNIERPNVYVSFITGELLELATYRGVRSWFQ